LGFEFRRIPQSAGTMDAAVYARGKKRAALLRKLKLVFRSYRSQPVKGLIEEINPFCAAG